MTLERRPSITLKGDEYTPEFRSLLNKAAKKAGKTQATFAAEAIAAAARRVLTGAPEEGEAVAAPPPAVIEEIRGELDRRFAEMVETLTARTNQQIEEALAEQRRQDMPKPRLERLRRLFGG